MQNRVYRRKFAILYFHKNITVLLIVVKYKKCCSFFNIIEKRFFPSWTIIIYLLAGKIYT